VRISDRIAALLIALVTAGACLSPQPGSADGAVAVGMPTDVAAEGFAFGYAINKSSVDQARAEALASCKKPAQGVDKRAQALCGLAMFFRNQCFAVAMDPKDATPGVGWAVASDKATATRDAMANCRATAGADRQGACEISRAECDGSGN
jgi:hypothetical protein